MKINGGCTELQTYSCPLLPTTQTQPTPTAVLGIKKYLLRPHQSTTDHHQTNIHHAQTTDRKPHPNHHNTIRPSTPPVFQDRNDAQPPNPLPRLLRLRPPNLHQRLAAQRNNNLLLQHLPQTLRLQQPDLHGHPLIRPNALRQRASAALRGPAAGVRRRGADSAAQ